MSGAEAALLGAAVGAAATIGVALLQTAADHRAEGARRRERHEAQVAAEKRAERQQRVMLTRRYLFQLQDAVESLVERLRNWQGRAGEEFAERIDPGYFRISTIYVLARALAAERILVLDGIYPQLDAVSAHVGSFFEEHGVEKSLDRVLSERLFRYHRLALAEAALTHEAQDWRIVTYTEFNRRGEDPAWALAGLFDLAYAALSSAKSEARTYETLEASLSELQLRLAAYAAEAVAG